MDGKAELLSERKQILQRLADIEALLEQHEAFEREFNQRAAAVLGKSRQDEVGLVEGSTKYVLEKVNLHRPRPSSSESVGSAFLRGDDQVGRDANIRVRKRSTLQQMQHFETIVREILGKAENPLNRKDMFLALQAKGVELPGASEEDKINTLGSRLTRMRDVENKKVGKNRGYWLTTKANPIELFRLQNNGGSVFE